MQFVPLLLGESLLQYHWNILCAVRTLFIPYCLGNSLIQYCWKVLCAIHTLFVLYHLGNFLLLLYFRETLCFFVHAVHLPPFTWAFCSFFVQSVFCVLVLHFLCFCNASTGVKGQTLAKEVRLLGKSTESYGKPKMTRCCSPKVDVQAWPLSNTTVQEELL